MKRLIIVLVLGVLLLSTFACAKAPVPSPAPPVTAVPAPTVAPRPAPAPAPIINIPGLSSKEGSVSMPTPAPAPSPTFGEVVNIDQSSVTDRVIVRTANIALTVDDVAETIDLITELTDTYDGYVVSSRKWREGERLVGTITIRVPAGRFDDAMRALREMAVDVNSETTSSKDVTEEYIDLSAKLRNLEATEEQLLRLMAKAEKVEDILNIQRELSSVRGDIEQTKGRMQYLERTSATSLITVSLEQAKLAVKFTADKARVKTGESVRFISQIAGGFAPYSYEWDFGDGNASTSQNPSHTYKSTGSYDISLKVTDDKGNTDEETRNAYIVVIPGWSAGNIASAAWNGLVTFGKVLADILIWLGIFSPVWIVIGGSLYWWRRRRGKKAA